MVCFAANIDLGWIALCKAGDWSDPASRVVVVGDAIKKGVFPALSAGFGSVLFRATTPPPPEGFWSREAQLEKAVLAQDKKAFFHAYYGYTAVLTMAMLSMAYASYGYTCYGYTQ